jgi:hypothetical protein
MIKVYYKGKVLFFMPDFITPVQLFAACKIIQDKLNLPDCNMIFRRGDCIKSK